MNHETLTFLNRQVTREREKKNSHPRTQRLINTNCCQVNIWSLTSLTWMLPTLRPKWINTGSIHRTSAITIGKLFVFPLDSFLSVIVAYQMCVCVLLMPSWFGLRFGWERESQNIHPSTRPWLQRENKKKNPAPRHGSVFLFRPWRVATVACCYTNLVQGRRLSSFPKFQSHWIYVRYQITTSVSITFEKGT